jgi:predicted ATPase
MITLVEALGYRSLRQVSQPLGPFHVLVGPNASGKTTFLDVIAFLGQLMSEDVEAVVQERTSNFYDLVWQRTGHRFELAIEARIPDALRGGVVRRELDTVRYEIALGINPDTQELGLEAEHVELKISGSPPRFPEESRVQESILFSHTRGSRTVVTKVGGDKDAFIPEIGEVSDVPLFKTGSQRSALRNLPGDESKFPVSVWLREFLTTGVQQIVLNSLLLRRPSPPGQARTFKPDGSNLPWVIADLGRRSSERKSQWIAHLQTSLPDIEDISTIERPEDRHRYLVIRYRGGLEVPSWMVSDGTLRMLALTLPAYLPDLEGIYLIEEPENGIHPRAIETVYQSLSSVYDAQVLLATHSPIILNLVEAEQVLCFAKTPEGATDIVRGSEHPALADWKREPNLGLLFAAGVLG